MSAATFDTNLLASGFVRANPHSAPVLLLDAWLAGVFRLIVSEHILVELERTQAQPYFTARFSPGQAERNLALLRRRAVITPITAAVHGIATHPEDDLVLATAVSGKAEYLVTGDLRLRQRVPEYQGVRLVSPREFLALLPS